jgi:signal transduction histidine kinase
MLAGARDVHPLDLCDRIPPADRLYYLQKPFGPLEIQQLVFALNAKWRGEAAWASGRRPAAMPQITESRALVAAIQHIPLATMAFDRNDVLLAANPEILRLFPELADSLAAGMSYADVQALKAERLLPSDTLVRAKPWLRDRMDWHAAGGGLVEQKFAGPRWVLMAERASAHDVTFCHYLDVTDLKRLEADRAGAAHMTAMAQAFAGLCERLQPRGAAGAAARDPRRLLTEGRVTFLHAPETGRASEEDLPLLQKLRAVAQRLKLDPEATDLNRLAAQTMQDLKEALPPIVTVEVVEAAGLWEVQTDQAALAEALGEVIRNAVEAMEDGGHLRVETANQRVTRDFAAARTALDAGDYVRISLVDSGPGMTAELAERALNPFFTSKTDPRHEGLGLSVAYGIVRQSGGYLEFDLDRKTGAKVDLYLPRSAAEDGSLGADVHVVSTKRRSRA